ncbi:MAG: aldehyde dehydrogenase family protein [SAR324 cluster bacterium]|nr:aldehyde dehydrogenase family protein [SAR324 cluster bacterium]
MIYEQPGKAGSKVTFKARYENFIGGKWVAPKDGNYFKNISPVNGEEFCEIPNSSAADVDLAVKAARTAQVTWEKTSVTERSNMLLKIADAMEANLELLALAETWDNGKGIRETINADVPLAIDHFRYYAGCIRAQEGSAADLDANTVSYHFHEPIGVVGQIIPWNFPLLMAAWKIAPALAAGCSVVLKPAEQTPASLLVFAELVQHLIPDGVLNIINGFGETTGAALSTHPGLDKIAFTGSTEVGKIILKAAADSLIPSTVELGGKSPNIFFADIVNHEDDYLSKAIEGLVLAFFNQGEVCTCPSRALVQESIYDEFMEKVLARVAQIKRGNPLDTDCMVGAQASKEQFDRIMKYLEIGKAEGAELLTGGAAETMDEGFAGGFYIQPTIFKGTNKMRIFQEEIFGPVISVATFKDEAEALAIANDTEYGLGAGVWTRDMNVAFRMGRGIKAGRVWTNCYHAYPAHAAFGGYKKSGIGRETHKMMLDHYQQTKNLLVSYDTNPLGFF